MTNWTGLVIVVRSTVIIVTGRNVNQYAEHITNRFLVVILIQRNPYLEIQPDVNDSTFVVCVFGLSDGFKRKP